MANTTIYVRLKATTAAGTYSGNVVCASSPATSVNVAIPSSTVSPAALSITAVGQSKTYGQTFTFAGTEFTSNGLQNGETIGSVSLSSAGAPPGASAGTYPITASAATGGSFTASNYNITYNSGSLTVNPKALSIVADGKVKAKGTSDPALTYVATGLVNSDTISGGLVRAAGEPPGTYAITQGMLDAGANYSVTFTGANFVITGPTAAADAATRVANSDYIKIPKATLLGNDVRANSLGATVSDGLTLAGVSSGTGNTVTESGAFVFYTPSNPAAGAPLTFTYTVSDGTSTDTAIVTVSTGAAQPFALQIVAKQGPTYNSGTDTTTLTVEFVSGPGELLTVEYSLDSSSWMNYPNNPVSTGPSGSFLITLTAAGDQTGPWRHHVLPRHPTIKNMIKLSRLLLSTVGLLAWAGSVSAQLAVDYGFTPNAAVPDLGQTTDTRVLGGFASFSGFTAKLTLTSQNAGNPMFLGDLYSSLTLGTAAEAERTTVLLNRPGRQTGSPAGSSLSSLDVTFADNAATNIFNTMSSTGTYRPDGRLTPAPGGGAMAYGGDGVNNLSALIGAAPASNSFTLLVSDYAMGGLATLTSWGMTATGRPPAAAR